MYTSRQNAVYEERPTVSFFVLLAESEIADSTRKNFTKTAVGQVKSLVYSSTSLMLPVRKVLDCRNAVHWAFFALQSWHMPLPGVCGIGGTLLTARQLPITE